MLGSVELLGLLETLKVKLCLIVEGRTQGQFVIGSRVIGTVLGY